MANKDLVVKMTINSKEFENGLQNAKKSVNSYESNIKTAAKTVGKLAAAYAAATAAVKTYASFAKQTQTWGDELANTLSACKTAWNTLQSEIIQGGNIAVGRMRELYAEAYKLSQLKDQMGTLQISQKLNKSLYLTPYNEARAEYQEAKSRGDKEGMKSAYSEMQRNLNEYAKESSDLINTSRETAKQLLVAHGITLKEGQDIKDLVLEVRDAQNGNLMGITRTLQDLSKKTTTTMYSPTAGAIGVASGGLEWGKAKMRNLGYSEAQIAAAERQLRMSEINDETYTEFANDILAAANALDEISTLRKSMSRLVNGTSGTGGGTGGGISTSSGLTLDQQMQYLTGALQNEILNNDRLKDAMVIDFEIPEEEIFEPETEELMNRVAEQMKLIQDRTKYAAAAMSSFGQAFGYAADIAGDNPFGNTLQALSGVTNAAISTASAMMALTGAETMEGVAEAFASAPPYMKLAMAGTALAGILSMMAAVKSSFAGSYANGGIVGGNSYTGDKLWIRANSGEMVLNQSQQTRLLNNMNGGGQVRFVIEGSQLKGVLDNYETIQNL
jgi:hypothetical protein